MWNETEYYLIRTQKPDASIASRIFGLVWRYTFDAPGFCLLDIEPGLDSHMLRAWMMELKGQLSNILMERMGSSFLFRSMARFDQQVTTKFHLDGAPNQSMLMLGYEPSRVESRLFLADYSKAAFDLRITSQVFLQEFNPMFRSGEELLQRYATELPQPAAGHSRILLINNSSLPFTEAQANPLGVMHKAVIVTPNNAEQRIINSTMLVTEGEEIGVDKQVEFLRTDEISPNNY